MPVIDHPVHPHGIRTGKYRPRCFNRAAFKPGYYATNRSYDEEGHWKLVMVWVENRMTKDCQVGKEPLSECEDCSHVRT